MLLVQLWDNWASLGHHVGFHRCTRSQFGTRGLWSRDTTGTTWPYNDIGHGGKKFIHRRCFPPNFYYYVQEFTLHTEAFRTVARLGISYILTIRVSLKNSHALSPPIPPSPGPYIPLDLTKGGEIEADPSWVPGVPIET